MIYTMETSINFISGRTEQLLILYCLFVIPCLTG